MANSLVLWSKQIGMSHACCLQRFQTKTFRGDTIQITVHNQINGPPEGTALHWHGLLQKNSQWVASTQAIVSMLTRDTDGWMVFQVFNSVRFHLEEASPILSSQISMVHRGITLTTLLSMPEVSLDPWLFMGLRLSRTILVSEDHSSIPNSYNQPPIRCWAHNLVRLVSRRLPHPSRAGCIHWYYQSCESRKLLVTSFIWQEAHPKRIRHHSRTIISSKDETNLIVLPLQQGTRHLAKTMLASPISDLHLEKCIDCGWSMPVLKASNISHLMGIIWLSLQMILFQSSRIKPKVRLFHKMFYE